MINRGLIDEPVFSFRLGTSEEDGGELTFGGTDDSAYTGSLAYVPVQGDAYWEVALTNISLGDDQWGLQDVGAVIDTGQSDITGHVHRSTSLSVSFPRSSQRYGRYA